MHVHTHDTSDTYTSSHIDVSHLHIPPRIAHSHVHTHTDTHTKHVWPPHGSDTSIHTSPPPPRVTRLTPYTLIHKTYGTHVPRSPDTGPGSKIHSDFSSPDRPTFTHRDRQSGHDPPPTGAVTTNSGVRGWSGRFYVVLSHINGREWRR